MKIKIFVLSLLSSHLAFVVMAQKQYSFLQLNNLDGLVSNQVACIHKDSRGFIWIGTKTGLSRYDGAEIVNYKHDSNDSTSIQDNYIINIQEDADGNLLILSSIGYLVFDINTEEFREDVNTYLGLENGQPHIDQIYCDQQKNLWIKPLNTWQFFRYNKVEKKIEAVFPANKPDHTPFIDFKQANQHYYYVFADGTIETYDDSSFQRVQTDTYLAGKVGGGSLEPGIFVDNDGDLWFYGNNKGVFHRNANGEWKNYAVETGEIRVSSNIIYKVIQDPTGIIWIATDHGGITLINKQSGTAEYIYPQWDNEKSLADNSVTDLLLDDNQVIWAATNKNGVSYYHESIHKFPHYRHHLTDKNSLPFSDVNCFIEDKKGNLWIGTNGGGLVYFNRQSNTYSSYLHNKNNPATISSNVVMSLLIDSNNQLWLGTYAGGVNRFNGHSFTRYQFNPQENNGLKHNNVWSVIEDDNQTIWVGTNGGGIQQYNPLTDKFTAPPNTGDFQLPTQHVGCLFKLRNGNLMVGTAYGAYLYDMKQQQYTLPPCMDNNSHADLLRKAVNGIFEDSRGLIWLATNEGLIVVNPQTNFVKLFTKDDGLPEDIMNCVQEDEYHTIWVSKSTGLSQIWVNSTGLNNAYNFQVHHFTEEDGLQANEFNPNASYKTRNNELIFGGVNGFNLFRSKDIVRYGLQPNVVFTDLQIYNKSIKPGTKINNRQILEQSITSTHEIELTHSMNVFSISFAALNFLIPDKIRYQYKLEGFNETWLLLNNAQPKVHYTNLNAGEYLFKVKASNNDGVWNENYATLKITILPPWYKSPLAYAIYLLLAIALVVYIRISVVQRQRRKFAIEQERLQARQNHEMDEMKLRFLTNVSHEFRTPLTLILTPLQKLLQHSRSEKDKKLLTVIDRNANNLLNLVNQLLDFRKLELHGMRYHPSYGNIVRFLQKVMKNFEEGFKKKHITFNLQHEVEEYLLYFDRDKLEKVMMNLLSNALKFTPKGGKVTVNLTIDQQSELVQIRVSDTGIGINKKDLEHIFMRFFQSESNAKLGISGSGIGLNLAREMVQLHNGTIEVESEEGAGATFTVSLPIVAQVPADTPVPSTSEKKEEPVSNAPVEDKNPPKEPTEKSKKPVLLLVEDNDDFRAFMKESLEEAYAIYEAADGKIALDLVHKHLPDLIISDVMMPNMDGMELCRILREDIRTSHIPIILLTARTTDEDNMKGLEIGADDYITKPFNLDLLLLRIKNLLQKRSKMQQQFQKTVEITPSEVQITSMDEKLIKKAISIVEDNMEEPGFSVEELSKELGMSRVYLYKKLTSITGKTPIEFMRIIRLKRAAQLLEKSQLSIAEVAYQVGFNSPRYFSKYFKQEYGMLPTAYVKAKAKNTDG